MCSSDLVVKDLQGGLAGDGVARHVQGVEKYRLLDFEFHAHAPVFFSLAGKDSTRFGAKS